MKNDQPTSLRRGFGYFQHLAAGMGGMRQERSPQQVNRAITDDKTVKKLLEAIESDPEWGPFVTHWTKTGLKVADILQALHNAQFDAWRRRKGFKKNKYAPF